MFVVRRDTYWVKSIQNGTGKLDWYFENLNLKIRTTPSRLSSFLGWQWILFVIVSSPSANKKNLRWKQKKSSLEIQFTVLYSVQNATLIRFFISFSCLSPVGSIFIETLRWKWEDIEIFIDMKLQCWKKKRCSDRKPLY